MTSLQILVLESVVSAKWQSRLLHESNEPWMLVAGRRVQARGEQVLMQVELAFLLVRSIRAARDEWHGEQHEPAEHP